MFSQILPDSSGKAIAASAITGGFSSTGVSIAGAQTTTKVTSKELSTSPPSTSKTTAATPPVTNPAPESEGGSSSGTIVLVVVAIILVIFCGVVAMLVKNFCSGNSETSGKESGQQVDNPMKMQSSDEEEDNPLGEMETVET